MLELLEKMLKISIFLEEGKSSARKKYLETGEISKRHFDDLIEGDPSPTKKYVDWMCRIALEEAWAAERIAQVVREFDRLASKGYLKNSDIYQYKTLEEVEKILKAPKNKEWLKKVSKERMFNIDKVKETDKYIILFPRTYEAVKKYGAHTKWCITTTQEDWEDVVRDREKYYFVIDKVNNRKYAVEAKTLFVTDDQDSSVDTDTFLDMLGISEKEAHKLFVPFNKKEYEEIMLDLVS